MKEKALVLKLGILIILVLVFILMLTPTVYANNAFDHDRPLSITLINSMAVFLIFILGIRIIYLTRGGFLSISFILIVLGIAIGWVTRVVFDFVTDSGILSTSYDIVSPIEGLGGIVLVFGFALLGQKLKS